MDTAKALKRIMPLRRLARDQAGTPEGDTALKQAEFFEEKYNLKIPDDAFEATSHEFETGYLWEEILLEVLASMLDLAHRRKGGRFILDGPKFAVDEAVEAFEFHRDVIERIAMSTAFSYMGAAVPGFGEALLEAIANSEERKAASEIKGEENDPEKGGRYTPGNVIDRVFGSKSDPMQEKITMLMQNIGSRNVRPFWERFK